MKRDLQTTVERKVKSVLGIGFHNGSSKGVVEILKQEGGLLTVPAAPNLVNIKNDPDYYKALLNSDVVIADSGYMVLISYLTKFTKINRISGLEFLVDFFADKDVKATKEILLVKPRQKEANANITYLNSIGFSLDENSSYIAPMYDKDNVIDSELLREIEEKKPKYIMLNIGGGIQEKLGLYLKENLSYKPAIICTGAAIAFLTGEQASIPTWGDRLFMGWLFRCIEKPELYVPRYLNSFKLLPFMLKYA
jgi:N-acetylglucosaminyldiphosphoundecaprenol N-acetyl-beta-D-mannosaminyltransferase